MFLLTFNLKINYKMIVQLSLLNKLLIQTFTPTPKKKKGREEKAQKDNDFARLMLLHPT